SRLYKYSWRSGISLNFPERFQLAVTETDTLIRNGHLIHSIKFDRDQIYLRSILQRSPAVFPRLMSLELQDIYSDEILADVLSRATGGLQRLVLHDYEGRLRFGPKSAHVLLTLHAPTLEIFKMRSTSQFPSRNIQQLLLTAPRLRELCLTPRARSNFNPDGFLDPNNIDPSLDWACTNLEVFVCQIGGLPRPDITRHINGDHHPSEYTIEGTPQQSLALHRRVYYQLSRLTRLRRLALGMPASYRRHQNDDRCRLFDCLAMTLESGLDLLNGLGLLREVELYYLETGIGQTAERAWVAENWPLVQKQPAALPPEHPERRVASTSSGGKSILQTEYGRLSKAIRHLNAARLKALETTTTDGYSATLHMCPKPTTCSYDVLSIWMLNKEDDYSYYDELADRLQDLEAQRSEIVKCILKAIGQLQQQH
ncbi:hypothetical protein BGX23_012278, partial [Mortierella sp. AD031]